MYVVFAPNPSGPPHLGTLRTYVVAWLEAQKRGLPVFVRFDANQLPSAPATYSRDWAAMFLRHLDALGMPPAQWSYLTDRMRYDHPNLPTLERFVNNKIYAMLPWEKGQFKVRSRLAQDWVPGKEVPMETLPNFTPNAIAMQSDDVWWYHPIAMNLLWMHMHGGAFIVRGGSLEYVRENHERDVARFLNLSLPDQILCGMVSTQKGALSKSKLAVDSVGTVGWAIKEIGADRLRENVLRSAGNLRPTEAIDIEELMA